MMIRAAISLILVAGARAVWPTTRATATAEYESLAWKENAVAMTKAFSQAYLESDEDCLAAGADANPYACTIEKLQGPLVCGTNANGDEIVDTAVYKRGECSKGPTHEVDGTGDDACISTDASWEASLEYLRNPTCETFKTDLKACLATDNDKLDLGAFTALQYAYVLNGEGVTNRAKVTVVGSCPSVVLFNAYLASDVVFKGTSTSYIIDPTATADATITVEGGASGFVLGGTNAASLMVTTTGMLRIADVVNSGSISITNVQDVFIASTTNNVGGDIVASGSRVTIMSTTNDADITFDNGDIHAYDVTTSGVITATTTNAVFEDCVNEGTIIFDGGFVNATNVVNNGVVRIISGEVHATFTGTGTIEVMSGVTGDIVAPEAAVTADEGSNVALTEVAAPTGGGGGGSGVPEAFSAAPRAAAGLLGAAGVLAALFV